MISEDAGEPAVVEPWEEIAWLSACPESVEELLNLAGARAEPADAPADVLGQLEAAYAAIELPAWRAAEIKAELAGYAEVVNELEALRLSPAGEDVVTLAGTLDGEPFGIVVDVPRATEWSLRQGYTRGFHKLTSAAGLMASCGAGVPLHHLAWGSAVLELTERPQQGALFGALETLEKASGDPRSDAAALANAVDRAALPRANYYFFPKRAW